MDIGEYRLEKSTALYDIKVSKWLCWCPVFKIKGIDADQNDFGECEDIDPEDKPSSYGCGNRVFSLKDPTEKVLKKYDINVDEYNEISSVLQEGLSFGYCGLCA